MSRKYIFLAFIGLLEAAMLTSDVQAQNQASPGRTVRSARNMMGGGGGSIHVDDISLPMILLQNDKVQNDLQLADDQKIKAKEAYKTMTTAEQEYNLSLKNLSGEKLHMKVQEMQEENADKVQKMLDEILQPSQLQRLKQIILQADVYSALYNPDIITALNITSEQQDKMKAVRSEYDGKMGEFRSMSMTKTAGMSKESEKKLEGKFTQRQERMQKTIKERNDKLLEILSQDQRDQFEKMQGAKIDVDIFSVLRGLGGRGA